MYIYLFLISIIVALIILVFKTQKNQNQSQAVLTPESMQSILSEVIKAQQAHQGQLANSDLLNIFRVPKSRGVYGETWLQSLLEQVLPRKHFILQHAFSTGAICDSVILLNNSKKLSIDSKFPKDNFLKAINALDAHESKEFRKEFYRDVKLHIDDISKKYILPAEGTMDFAFMFIPAEGIYYQAFIQDDNELLDYAYRKNVFIASPNTLYIYLQFVLHGLKGYQIEQNARNLQSGLEGIIRDLKLFDDENNKLKEKLDQAQKNFMNGNKYFERVQTGLRNISDLSIVDREK